MPVCRASALKASACLEETVQATACTQYFSRSVSSVCLVDGARRGSSPSTGVGITRAWQSGYRVATPPHPEAQTSAFEGRPEGHPAAAFPDLWPATTSQQLRTNRIMQPTRFYTLWRDTDQNLRHNVNYIPPPSHAPCGGGVWGGSRSPCPYHRCRRASSAHYRTHSHSHMLVGTCQAAQPLFGCRAARSRFFTPSPLTSA